MNMRASIVAILLAVSSLLVLLAPVVVAAPKDEEIPQVRIQVDNAQYKPDDTVNVTVHFTVNGRVADPDYPGVAIAILENWTIGTDPKDIELVKDVVHTTKGEFKANFTVEPWRITTIDPTGMGPPIMGKAVVFIAQCIYNDVISRAVAYAWIEEGAKVAVEVSHVSPVPGDTVVITVTTYNDTLIDAQDVTVQLTAYDGVETTDLGYLTVNRESLGTYKASYTIPFDINGSTDFYVHAGASFPDYNHSRYLFNLFDRTFRVRFFNVWGQNISASDAGTDFAVWVADPQGVPLAGARVDATADITYATKPPESIQLTNGTNATGGAGFSFHGVAGALVNITGTITKGGFYQHFHAEGAFDDSPSTVGPPSDATDFTMQPFSRHENTPLAENIHVPGSLYTQEFRAYNSTGTITDKRVNWYVIDRQGFLDINYTVLESGYGVTDANGDMTVTFHVPGKSANAWLMFEANVWNSNEKIVMRTEDTKPLVDAGIFPIDDAIKITVDRVTKGVPIELRAQTVLARNALIGYQVKEIDRADGLSDWGPFDLLGPRSADLPVTLMPKTGPDVYGVDMRLPSFVPEDQDYVFMVLTVDLDLFRITMNYAVLGYNESTTKGLDAQVSDKPDFLLAGGSGDVVLTVDNTGQGTDTYTVAVASGPQGWLNVPTEGIVIAPGERGRVTLPIHVPASTDEAVYYFNLTISSKDPSVNTSIEVPINVEVNGVRVESDRSQAIAVRGDHVDVNFSIVNLGQGADTFTLALAGNAVGWASLPQQSITVANGAKGHVTVRVDVPQSANERDYPLTLTATSHDGVTTANATFMLSVLVDGVQVTIDPPSTDAWRGDTVTFTLRLANTGQGPDLYGVICVGDFNNTEDWRVVVPQTVGVEEGRTTNVTLTLTVPTDMDEGYYMFNVMATSRSGLVSATAHITVHVWVNGVTLSARPTSANAHRGEQVTFALDITNTGQGRDVYNLTYMVAPWATFVTFGSQAIAIDQGRSTEIQVSVGLVGNLDTGTYNLTVMATSQDGATGATLTFPIHMIVKGVRVSSSQSEAKVQQGKRVEVSLTITNTGQGSDTYTILLTGPASRWAKAETNVVTLAQGANRTVKVTIDVPKNATRGASLLNVTVLSTDEHFSDRAQLALTIEKAKASPGFGAVAALACAVSAAIALRATRRRRD